MKKLLVVLSLLIAGVAQGAPRSVYFEESRTIRIVGQINANILKLIPVLERLQEEAPGSPIYLLISSPGGRVDTANLFISAMHVMQARGTQIICGVATLAASAAFSILTECDQRYVLPAAKLLFHSVRIKAPQGIITAPEVLMLAIELDALNQISLKSICKKALGNQNCDKLEAPYYGDKRWDAVDLAAFLDEGFLTVVDDISGIKNLFQTSGISGVRAGKSVEITIHN